MAAGGAIVRQAALGASVLVPLPTGVGQKRGDLLITELGKHFDLSVVTLDEVVDGGFPALELWAGLARGVKTAEQERAFRAWRVAAQIQIQIQNILVTQVKPATSC